MYCTSLIGALMQDLRPVPPPEKSKEDILLFFKLYDPSKEELRYLFFFPSNFLTVVVTMIHKHL